MNQNYLSGIPETNSFYNNIFVDFANSPVKVAIQKDGELTDISRDIYEREFGVKIDSYSSNSRKLLSVCSDGAKKYGVVYARNKALGGLVVNGAVDWAIVGMDRIIEERLKGKVQIIKKYLEYSWDIVLATPKDVEKKMENIKVVATSYPEITKKFFKKYNLAPKIVTTIGGTEAYAYLNFQSVRVDAIVDIKVTGASLAAHNLEAWNEVVEKIYPVLIANKGKSIIVNNYGK